MRHDVNKGIYSEIQQLFIQKLKILNPNILKKELSHCSTSFCNAPEVLLLKCSSTRKNSNKNTPKNTPKNVPNVSKAHRSILPGAIIDGEEEEDEVVTPFSELNDA